jgi:hypothetical protein
MLFLNGWHLWQKNSINHHRIVQIFWLAIVHQCWGALIATLGDIQEAILLHLGQIHGNEPRFWQRQKSLFYSLIRSIDLTETWICENLFGLSRVPDCSGAIGNHGWPMSVSWSSSSLDNGPFRSWKYSQEGTAMIIWYEYRESIPLTKLDLHCWAVKGKRGYRLRREKSARNGRIAESLNLRVEISWQYGIWTIIKLCTTDNGLIILLTLCEVKFWFYSRKVKVQSWELIIISVKYDPSQRSGWSKRSENRDFNNETFLTFCSLLRPFTCGFVTSDPIHLLW